MGEPNDALRAARERVESPHATGLSLSRMELAELANEKVYFETGRVIELSANYVGKLERGLVRWPNADYRAGLRAALGARTDAELGFRRPSRSRTTVVDVDRKDFLRAAIGIGATSIANGPLADLVASAEPAPVPSIVGVTEIEQVSATARVFSELDRSYGGGLLREAMTAQLRHAVALLDVRCSQRDRGDLFSAVGDLGHRAGFMAFDAHAHDDARRRFRLAQACAEEADDWHLRAKVLLCMAGQAIWCGDPDTGLTLVELAMVRADRLMPSERAMLFAARAQALARLRRAEESVRAIGQADEQFSAASPANMTWRDNYDAAKHANATGDALYHLGLTGRFVGDATHRLNAATAGYTETRTRSRAMAGAKLASLTMVTGDPVQAAQIGSRALTDAGHVRSHRMTAELRELRTVAEPHKRVAEVAELRSRIGAATATT